MSKGRESHTLVCPAADTEAALHFIRQLLDQQVQFTVSYDDRGKPLLAYPQQGRHAALPKVAAGVTE